MRFTAITIENFKNVEYGKISFENPRRPDGPSIVGLYGQNGSGKSALVDCLLLFKSVWSIFGDIPEKFAYYINTKSDCARITYELEGEDVNGQRFFAVYVIEFSAKAPGEDAASILESYGALETPENKLKSLSWSSPIRVTGEVLKFKREGDSRFRVLFSLSPDFRISPKASREMAIKGWGSEQRLRFFIAEQLEQGRSLIASMPITVCDENRCVELEMDRTLMLLKWDMADFAFAHMLVVGTKESESIEAGQLTLFYNKKAVPEYELVNMSNGDALDYANDRGTVILSTDPDQPSSISSWQKSAAMNTLAGINEVLSVLVPGLSLQLETRESPVEGFFDACVFAKRDIRLLPLACESRGIQKLVSIASLLVGVYNKRDFTAVIDELDSGIFEYLLGETLRVISEEGQGQLIFTSHNLRPLEVLDKGYIAFTTSNPKERYIRMKNVKTTNNLRDFYYRSILLGGQGESIYEPSTNGEISLAFMKAGESAFRARKAYDDELEEYQEELTSRLSSYSDSQNRTAEESEDSDA